MSELDIEKILKVNQLIHIEINDESEFPVRHRSRIENIDDNVLYLATPIKDRVPVFIVPGTPLNVWLWDELAVYIFHTRLIKNITGTVYELVVAKPDSIKRVQNREFVRVSIVIEVLITYLNKNGVKEEIWCKTRDISGGGMMVAIGKPNPLERNAKIEIEFTINEHLIKAEGLIVWNDWELDSNGIEKNLVGMKFTNITNRTVKE
jgi:c-di-GMP-binding flagellar brake protein YcgR